MSFIFIFRPSYFSSSFLLSLSSLSLLFLLFLPFLIIYTPCMIIIIITALSEEEEETCPICQDDMKPSQNNLTWCRRSCGNNMHAKCMLQYCQFRIANKQQPSCPLCREPVDCGDMELLHIDCKGKATSKNTCVSTNCTTCSCLLRAEFFRWVNEGMRVRLVLRLMLVLVRMLVLLFVKYPFCYSRCCVNSYF